MSDAPRSPAEVLARLAETRAQLVATLEPLSDAQWIWTPDEVVWSAALLAEHLAVVDFGTSRLLTERFDTLEEVSYTSEQQAKKDAMIPVAVANRGVKIEAPAFVRPKNRFATRAECMAKLLGARDAIVQAVQTHGDRLRTRSAPHPALGSLDGLQWALFSAEHGARHMAQFVELRSLAGFPTA